MIKRIFKTIFILTLCLGITLSANAAGTQVSDGSAFVTKAELAYQLNNLSNRMTQLENSLDSKIDEMVSSYLTRNGIWNGLDVDIDKSEARLVSTNFQDSWTSWSEQEKTVWSKTATTKKSGMMVTTVHVEGKRGTASTSQYRCYLRITGGSYCGFEDDARVSLRMTETINGSTYTRSRIEIANSQQRTTYVNIPNPGTGYIPDDAHNGTHILPLPLNNDYVLLGFVSKDSTVQIAMIHYVADFQAGDSSFQYWGISGGAYLSTVIKDSKIY